MTRALLSRLVILGAVCFACMPQTGAALSHSTRVSPLRDTASADRGFGDRRMDFARGGARGGRQFGGGGVRPEQPVVAQFDKNADGRLNLTERRAAREWLQSTGAANGGGRGRGGANWGTPDPGPRLRPADVKTYPAGDFYDPAAFRTMFFEFEEPDWEQELMTFYNTDVDVPATVTIDGKVYKDVGVHFRGNSSYRMIPKGYKHSFNLTFDFADDKQRIGGYRGTNLLNANNDPTFLRVPLFSLIGQDYLPIAKANLMRVAINGESWGVYANTEQVKKDFVENRFGDKGGARWKAPGSPNGRAGLNYLGDSVEAYKRLYEIKSEDDPKAWAAFINLCKVLDTTPPERLVAALSPLLDIDGALKFIALDVVSANTDGYWTRASDYNIYLDPKGKFHVFPHDFNETLGVAEGRGGGDASTLDPLVGLTDASKPLRSRLLAVPALRAKYLGYVRDIAQRGLDWAKLEPKLTQWQNTIRADVLADTHKLSGNEQFDLAELRRFIEQRRTYLLNYR